MEKNELAKAGKNFLTDLVRNDKLEGLPKVEPPIQDWHSWNSQSWSWRPRRRRSGYSGVSHIIWNKSCQAFSLSS